MCLACMSEDPSPTSLPGPLTKVVSSGSTPLRNPSTFRRIRGGETATRETPRDGSACPVESEGGECGPPATARVGVEPRS